MIPERASELLGRPVARAVPISGGDVCRAFRLELADGSVRFAKSPREDRPGMVSEEARGLAWLAEAQALRVPEVDAVGEADGNAPALLVLEWIESAAPGAHFGEQLGRGLARLHAAGAPGFGLDRDNFIGLLPQTNRPRPDWPAFLGEQRLAPLLRRAVDDGRVDAGVSGRLELVIERLPQLTGPAEPPARLHGDLWSGNVMADEQGRPCLIDPAVYGGHREMDLAMLELFGSPAPGFFEAYREETPLSAGRSERVALCQLYPLLVHVCLFGGSYVGALERALAGCERL